VCIFSYISLSEVIGIVAAYADTIPITSNNDIYVTEVNIVTLAKYRLRAL